MQIDWDKAINDIFLDKVTCLRCGRVSPEIVAGYSRAPELALFSPRRHECPHPDDCEARRLITVCEPCSRELRLRARPVDQESMMGMILEECRRELDECVDYLADYWQEDLDVSPDKIDLRLEEFDPELFLDENRRRERLEQEYLSMHSWFREHSAPIPDPGWRSEYVEEIIALGYKTLLGD
jgi:hypothetical protein